MLGVFAFPALLPVFLAEWSLSNTQAGWLTGIYFAAYALSAPVLISLTDRLDARKVYLFGTLVAAAAALGFALLAEGFASALVFRILGGIALAGTYMPGLRMMVDRIPEEKRARAVPLYTASFSLGTAASYLFAGQLHGLIGWPLTFALTAAAAVAAAGLALMQRPCTPEALPEQTTAPRLLDFRPIFRNRAAMGFILAYAAHTWELFAFRSWLVAFLAAVALAQGLTPEGWLAPATIASLGALLAMGSSITGAELATRFGRARVSALFAVLSASLALGIGFAFSLPYWMVAVLTLAYAALIQLDSASLNTGTVVTAEPGRRGATLAVHSLLGFLAGFVGPLAFGVVLDLGGPNAWGLAFATIGLVAFLGPPVLLWSARKRTAP